MLIAKKNSNDLVIYFTRYDNRKLIEALGLCYLEFTEKSGTYKGKILC